jgi:predicted amidohydrolase
MTDILVKNARVIDGSQDRPSDAIDMRLSDGHVQEVGLSLSAPDTATVIDAKNSFVMPGLIDAHVHVNAQNANLKENAALPDAIATVGTMNLMQGYVGTRLHDGSRPWWCKRPIAQSDGDGTRTTTAPEYLRQGSIANRRSY